MEGIREYILSVVASALICGSVKVLFHKGGASATLINTICGIYMAFIMIAPLQKIDFSAYTNYFSGFTEEAKQAVSDGQEIAADEQQAYIKEQIEAYILEKAISLGAEISVYVTLSDTSPPKPMHITIKGAVSPYVKTVLRNYLTEQLGVPEEAQSWT